jgi:hypothetical protein
MFILGKTGMGKTVTCAFALLPSKEKLCSSRLAAAIKQEMDKLEVANQMKTIMMDYERGVIESFKTTFEDAQIAGCDFHWKSCIRKRIAGDGLQLLYNNDIQFSMLIRYIWALSCVPPDMIQAAWTTVIQEKVRQAAPTWEKDYEKQLATFLKYIDRTWIGELNTRTQVRKKPLFPVTMWNKYQPILDGDALTNNVVEGYNNAFCLSLPARPTDWHLMERFQKEEAMTKASLQQAAMGNLGPDENKARAHSRRDRAEKLRNLVLNYSNMSLKDYLDGLIFFYE